jgi:hypothetical protein
VRDRVLPQMEKDISQSVQNISSSDVNQAAQQVREAMEKLGYQFAKTPEGKTSLLVEPKSGVQINLATDKVAGQLLRELVTQRTQHIQREEAKPSQQQKRGLRL